MGVSLILFFTQDKDCSTLEKSSLIPFTFWKVNQLNQGQFSTYSNSQATVDQLVSEDPTQRTAILHYVQVFNFFLQR